MLTASPVSAKRADSPTVPSAELTLPQQGLDLPPLGLQARGLGSGAAAVGRHGANQTLINVGTVEDMKESQETGGRSQAAALINR